VSRSGSSNLISAMKRARPLLLCHTASSDAVKLLASAASAADDASRRGTIDMPAIGSQHPSAHEPHNSARGPGCDSPVSGSARKITPRCSGWEQCAHTSPYGCIDRCPSNHKRNSAGDLKEMGARLVVHASTRQSSPSPVAAPAGRTRRSQCRHEPLVRRRCSAACSVSNTRQPLSCVSTSRAAASSSASGMRSSPRRSAHDSEAL
jgi:hypothetical protein